MLNRVFSPFPILTTERLTLRQLSQSDKEEIFALRSDNHINQYLDRQPSKSLEDAINFINKVKENTISAESVYWAITITGSKKLVGTICLFDFSDEDDKCEIGYELSVSYQGQGIMQEAAGKVIDYGVQTIGLKRIEAITHNDNQSSIRLLEKFDFRKSDDHDQGNTIVYILRVTA